MIKDPKHLAIARRSIGVREIKGPKHEPRIVEWLERLGAWWRDDETPWCGVALAAWMQEAGLPYPKTYYRALAWSDYGKSCGIQHGAIAVLTRKGGGHVGLVTGVSHDMEFVRLLGGNQGDCVCEAWFPVSRVTEFRMPEGVDWGYTPLAKVGEMSRGEA